MPRKSGLFPILAGLVVAGGVLLLLTTKVLVLRLQNMDHPRALSVKIMPQERFSISYIHSIYQEPVTEEFEAALNAITLKGMRTNSLAVVEQFGFEDPKRFRFMERKLNTIFFRVAEGQGQRLIVRGRTIYFGEIGTRGDRIKLSAISISAGSYLFGR